MTALAKRIALGIKQVATKVYVFVRAAVAAVALGLIETFGSPRGRRCMAVGTLLPEVLWNLSFFGQLASGRHVSGLTDYMFDARRPLYVRALSLFHVILPGLLLWLIHRLGYDPRALAAQTVLAWVVLVLTYWLTDPRHNVNWVFGLGAKPQRRIAPIAHLVLLMAGFPLLIHFPTHLLLQRVFG